MTVAMAMYLQYPQVMVLSAVDKLIYRETEWIIGLDEADTVGEIGVSAQVVCEG